MYLYILLSIKHNLEEVGEVVEIEVINKGIHYPPLMQKFLWTTFVHHHLLFNSTISILSEVKSRISINITLKCYFSIFANASMNKILLIINTIRIVLQHTLRTYFKTSHFIN